MDAAFTAPASASGLKHSLQPQTQRAASFLGSPAWTKTSAVPGTVASVGAGAMPTDVSPPVLSAHTLPSAELLLL